LRAVLGQEVGRGDEHRAGEAGVRVRAGLLQWKAAVAVRSSAERCARTVAWSFFIRARFVMFTAIDLGR
jgi:hypothetical protein